MDASYVKCAQIFHSRKFTAKTEEKKYRRFYWDLHRVSPRRSLSSVLLCRINNSDWFARQIQAATIGLGNRELLPS